MQKFISQILPAVKMLMITIVCCGIIYTAAVLLLSNLLFSSQAEENRISTRAGEVIANAGQTYCKENHLWGRPQPAWAQKVVTARNGKLLLYSTPANNALSDPSYQEWKEARYAWVAQNNPEGGPVVPEELYTASASGMDPDISWQAAEYQIPRLVKTTGLDRQTIEKIFQDNTSNDLFSDRTVNVNGVNAELDDLLSVQ